MARRNNRRDSFELNAAQQDSVDTDAAEQAMIDAMRDMSDDPEAVADAIEEGADLDAPRVDPVASSWNKPVVDPHIDPILGRSLRAEQRAREVDIHERMDKKPAKATKGKVDLAPKAPKAKAVKPPKECECGCGGLTGGGRFRPGHDATLKSRLIKEARATNGETIAQSAAAWERIETLGWDHLFDVEEVEVTAQLNRLKKARKSA